MRDDIFIPEHRTKVLPLRWLANYIFHPISMFFFKISLRVNDKIVWDSQYNWYNKFIESFGWKWYIIFDKPYSLWGTYYKFDSDIAKAIAEDLKNDRWNDYDENDIPYWDYFWHNDEETGDAWRLIRNKNE